MIRPQANNQPGSVTQINKGIALKAHMTRLGAPDIAVPERTL
jgi:hypothetical protein